MVGEKIMSYCFDHAMREISMIEYYDPNKKLGKSIFRIPTKDKKKKCTGANANEKRCTKWGIFFIGFIPKKIALQSDRQVMK